VSLRVQGNYPSPVATPNTLSFPYTPLGSISAAQTLSITSNNNDPITLTVVDGPYVPFILPQGNSCSHTPCQLSVAFAPTAANTAPADGGNSYDEILVTDLLSGQAFVVNVSGINTPPPPPPPATTMSLSSTSLTFPPTAVGDYASTSESLNITNSGSQPLYTTITPTGPNQQDFNLLTFCPSPISVGQYCLLTFTFSPTATGLRTETIQITANTSTSPVLVPISGTGQ